MSDDGLGRRIKKVVANSGGLNGTWVYFYNGQQMIEAVDGSANLLVQAYHGTRYPDELLSMKTDYGYMVVHQDANWNVVSTTDLAGNVLERTFYSPYGQPTVQGESFFGDYDADGEVDNADDGNLGSGQTCWGTPSDACRVFDFNQDGTLDSADQTVMTALVALASTNHAHNNRTSSPTGMIFAHQGLILDPEIAQYYNRARTYNPVLQRFMQRDPLGYRDGSNQYAYTGLNPVTQADPNGLLFQLGPPKGCPNCDLQPPALPKRPPWWEEWWDKIPPHPWVPPNVSASCCLNCSGAGPPMPPRAKVAACLCCAVLELLEWSGI